MLQCGSFLTLVAIIMVLIGLHEIHEARSFKKPISITCEQFMKTVPGDGWFHITGCELDVTEAIYVYKKSSLSSDADVQRNTIGNLRKVYLPVHCIADWNQKTQSFAPGALLVETSDPGIIAMVQQSKRVDAMPEKEREKWFTANVDKLFLHKDIDGMIESGFGEDSEMRDLISKGQLENSLAPKYVILDEGLKPSMGWAVGFLGLGLLMGVFACLFWGAVWFGWKRRQVAMPGRTFSP